MPEKKGTALLVVYTDVDPEHVAEFNAWYDQEHVPERMSAPGFLDAARYEALRGGPRYLAVYELESIDALHTEEYLRMSNNPTEWTQRMSPNVVGRGTVRLGCTQIYPAENDSYVMGRGMAPALQIGRMDVPEPDVEAKYNYYYDNVRTPGNLQIPGCLHVRRYHVVEGGPKYLTMYEFEHEKVPETLAWETQRGQDTMHEYIGGPTATRQGLREFTGAFGRPGRSKPPKNPLRATISGGGIMPRQLTRQEAHDFLDSKPGWIVLTTLDSDGFPHSVPLGYFRLGDEILMGVRANTHKLTNIQQNPKVSLLIESGSTLQDIRGLMVQGVAQVHSSPEDILHYSREAAKLRGVADDELPAEPRPGAAYIRVTPERIRSWDYSQDEYRTPRANR